MEEMALKEFLEETKNRVDPVIEEILKLNLHSDREEMVLHQVRMGGKRLRPALAAASCFLFGGKWEDVLYPAAGLEILHNYSLIIDDMIDRSHIRRGQPTVWKKYGQSMAHCIGAHYAASLMQAAQGSRKGKEVTECLAQALKILTEGEIKDILADIKTKEEVDYLKQRQVSNISLEDYFEIIKGKTATLFSASTRIGAIVAEASSDFEQKIADYGFNLGIAFQISDDILDLFGREDSFGKEIGHDIVEGKGSNIVILYALQEMGDKQKADFMSIMNKKDTGDQDIVRAVELVSETKAKDLSLNLGRDYVKRAKGNLFSLPESQGKEFLFSLADFIFSRDE